MGPVVDDDVIDDNVGGIAALTLGRQTDLRNRNVEGTARTDVRMAFLSPQGNLQSDSERMRLLQDPRNAIVDGRCIRSNSGGTMSKRQFPELH